MKKMLPPKIFLNVPIIVFVISLVTGNGTFLQNLISQQMQNFCPGCKMKLSLNKSKLTFSELFYLSFKFVLHFCTRCKKKKKPTENWEPCLCNVENSGESETGKNVNKWHSSFSLNFWTSSLWKIFKITPSSLPQNGKF